MHLILDVYNSRVESLREREKEKVENDRWLEVKETFLRNIRE